MCKTCKYSNCAICPSIHERSVFKSILKTTYPDLYICKEANYKITNRHGDEFIITSLENVIISKRGSYIQDIFTAEHIYLNKDNFEVICTRNECNVAEPYVEEYQHKKSS